MKKWEVFRDYFIKNLLGKLHSLLKNTHLTIEKDQYNVIKNKSVSVMRFQ